MNKSRRQFLQAAAMAPVAARAASSPASSIRLSLMLWTLQGSFDEHLETAAQAGISSTQLVSEWANWSDAEFSRINALRRSLRLGVDALLAQTDWKHRPVTLVNPADRAGFLADLRRAFVAAQKLECPRIILMSGDNRPGVPHDEQLASIVEGMKRGGELAARENLTLIIEPLNSLVNHPGYFLTSAVEGLQAVKQVDNPHVKLLFDIYHEQVQEGNIIDTLTRNIDLVAVCHVADCPGRHDPGSGELNYPNIYRAIAKAGFRGHVAMEYLPIGDPVASLTRAVADLRKAVA
ncbi:MAG TPA: TIM barrel protein [Bryobacterales bacterium]|nr:TIM barrel protein [Bryobacterales bacterium]